MEAHNLNPGTMNLNGQSKPRNVLVRLYQRVYRFFGFQKGYNFPLYFVFVGTLFGFTLARMEYLDFSGTFFKSTIPGEVFWYRSGYHAIGIRIHLIGALFGGLLAAFQFTPVIRHNFLWLHRITGYFAIILLLLGNVGAFMILDHAVGGQPVSQVYFALLGIAVTGALLVAYINIKRQQIDQHRAWMIRAWAWAASIITLRLILLASIGIVTTYGYVTAVPITCREIFYLYKSQAGIPDVGNPTAQVYPSCGPNAATSTTQVIISSNSPGPEAGAALIRSVFTMSGWLATTIHVFLVELYLWLTPAESYRLRQVSYERQVERGLRKEGQYKDAGIGSTRFGDAPHWWSLPESKCQLGKKQLNDSRDANANTTRGVIEAPKDSNAN